MDRHDEQEALSSLRAVPRIFEAGQETKFECCRNAADGHVQTLTVTVLDAGPNDPAGPATRYRCRVTSDDGKRAGGDSAETVRAAIASVHWGDLDLKARRAAQAKTGPACEHPRLSKQYVGGFDTGDYLCAECGQTFTGADVKALPALSSGEQRTYR